MPSRQPISASFPFYSVSGLMRIHSFCGPLTFLASMGIFTQIYTYGCVSVSAHSIFFLLFLHHLPSFSLLFSSLLFCVNLWLKKRFAGSQNKNLYILRILFGHTILVLHKFTYRQNVSAHNIKRRKNKKNGESRSRWIEKTNHKETKTGRTQFFWWLILFYSIGI